MGLVFINYRGVIYKVVAYSIEIQGLWRKKKDLSFLTCLPKPGPEAEKPWPLGSCLPWLPELIRWFGLKDFSSHLLGLHKECPLFPEAQLYRLHVSQRKTWNHAAVHQCSVPNRLRIIFSLSQKPSGELMQEAEFRQQEAARAIIPSDWNIGWHWIPVCVLTHVTDTMQEL